MPLLTENKTSLPINLLVWIPSGLHAGLEAERTNMQTEIKTLSPELLEQIRGRLVDEFHPVKIILFGSHAWGQPDQESDIDLLVIVPEQGFRHTRWASRAHRILGDLEISKDIIIRSESEIERASRVPASLESQIMRKGILLYG